MINVSAQYNTNIANGGHYEWQILNNGTAVDNIMEGKITQTLYEQASIGNVIAKQLEFTFVKGTTIDVTYPLVVQFRATGSTNSAWYDKGTYWVDTIESSPYSDLVKVKAYDALLKANVTYMATGTWTATTDKAVVQAIAADIGVNIESGTATVLNTTIAMNESPSIGANGTTDMQMLSYVGVLRGGNWIINDANELELIRLFAEKDNGHAAVDIGDAVDDFDASPAETVTGVCLWVNESTYYRYPNVTDSAWEALGGRKIEAELPIGASQTRATSLYVLLGNKTYQPYSAPKAWVDPKWQLGDKITMHSTNPVSSVICNQTIQLTALATSSLSAEGQNKLTSNYPYLTPVERKIAQNEAQTRASITVLGNEIQSTVQDVNGLRTDVNQNASGLEVVTSQVDEQSSYIRWDGANSTVKIGATDAPTEAQISPNGFAVVQDGEKILEAEGRKVVTKHFKATNDMTVGRYQWIDEGTGGFSLVYVG